MAIIVIRHGQSKMLEEYKKLKTEGIPSRPENFMQFLRVAEIYESNSDSPLSEKGQGQILETAYKLIQSEYPISRAYVSPTKRTQETYEIIAEEFARQGIIFPNCKFDPRIGIVEAGVFHGIRQNRSDDEVAKFFGEKDQKGVTGKEFAHDYLSGETILQASQRIYNFLDDTKGIWQRKNMLIITHKSTIRVIHSYFEHDLNNKEFFEYDTKNGEISIYGEIIKGKMTSKEAFNIGFRNFISKVPKERAKGLSSFFSRLASKRASDLDVNTEDKKSTDREDYEI